MQTLMRLIFGLVLFDCSGHLHAAILVNKAFRQVPR